MLIALHTAVSNMAIISIVIINTITVLSFAIACWTVLPSRIHAPWGQGCVSLAYSSDRGQHSKDASELANSGKARKSCWGHLAPVSQLLHLQMFACLSHAGFWV